MLALSHAISTRVMFAVQRLKCTTKRTQSSLRASKRRRNAHTEFLLRLVDSLKYGAHLGTPWQRKGCE